MTIAALVLSGCLIQVDMSSDCPEEGASGGAAETSSDAADDSGDEGLGLPAAGDCGSGGVSFEASGGSVEDLTATFGAGEDGEPVAWTFDTPGTLTVCEGRWFVALTAAASLQIVGPEGHETTILSGGGAARVVTVDGDDLQVSLEGVTLSDGAASDDTNGGGLGCTGSAELALREVALLDSAASRGGGLSLEGCAATLSEVTIEGNRAEQMGGGIYLEGAALSGCDVLISTNDAAVSGGGIYVRFYSELSLMNGTVEGNAAGDSGGGIYAKEWSQIALDEVDLLANSTDLSGGGLYVKNGAAAQLVGGRVAENVAERQGGGLYMRLEESKEPTTASSTAFEQNDPQDGYNFSDGGYDWGAATSFSCTASRCE